MPVEIIVGEECIGCGRCRAVCPKGPRVWDRRLNDKNKCVYFAKHPDYCIFCKICVGICPVGTIIVRSSGEKKQNKDL